EPLDSVMSDRTRIVYGKSSTVGRTGRGEGSDYITLKEDGITKVMAGLTTLQEVFKVVAV
ncbi:MAG: hypothetical protein AAF085_16705, partial [Planctomycetota bacterium]